MWRIENAIWRIKALIRILFNPFKLWYLPELINNVNFLTHHEEDLHQERDVEKGIFCNGCKNKPDYHKWFADDLKEMLGPFYVKWETHYYTDEELEEIRNDT